MSAPWAKSPQVEQVMNDFSVSSHWEIVQQHRWTSYPSPTFVQKLGQIKIMEDSWLMTYMSEDGHDRDVSMEPKQCCHCQRAFQINLGKFIMVIRGHFSCASQRWSITESLPLDLMAPAATGQGGKLRSSLSSFNAKSKQKIECSSCLTWINLSNHAVQSCTGAGCSKQSSKIQDMFWRHVTRSTSNFMSERWNKSQGGNLRPWRRMTGKQCLSDQVLLRFIADLSAPMPSEALPS